MSENFYSSSVSCADQCRTGSISTPPQHGAEEPNHTKGACASWTHSSTHYENKKMTLDVVFLLEKCNAVVMHWQETPVRWGILMLYCDTVRHCHDMQCHDGLDAL